MKSLTREWLKYAEVDLKTAEEVLGDEQLTPSVAFHCQQCIEKCFKAVLCESGMQPPRIHSLLKLLDLIRTHISIADIDLKSIVLINETYIDSRYPADSGLLPEGFLSVEKAQLFYETANKIFHDIFSQIEK
ncbi:MAG TPA: HEPN domain-containing protein [Spirochaetia bacterium]|nr:HEPN domain-containing protein [Spirochaetia bacterium]